MIQFNHCQSGGRNKAALVVVGVLLATQFLGILAAADTATPATSFRGGRMFTGGATVLGKVYTAGGLSSSGSTTEITQMSIGMSPSSVANLPLTTYLPAVTGAGANLWVFGGTGPGGPMVSGWKYDTVNGGVTQYYGVLGNPVSEGSAVYTGAYIYIIGGWSDGGGYSSKVLRYDPADPSRAATLAGNLPSARGGTSAVFDSFSNAIWIFGGEGSGSDEIVRFDLATGQSTVPYRLPNTRHFTSAVWDGYRAYIFGGVHPGGNPVWIDTITEFTPSTGTVRDLPVKLPSVRCCTSAGWIASADSSAYIMGGQGVGGAYLDQTVKFTPAPPAPVSLVATSGPALGYVTLTWDATPLGRSTAFATGYNIYRGTSPGGESASPYATVPPYATSYVDTAGTPGTRYYYNIAAYNNAGASPPTAEANARAANVPSVPLGLQVTPGPGRGELGLAWSTPLDDGAMPITGYKIYSGPTTTNLPTTRNRGTATSFVDTGLADGETRCFALAATNGAGTGPQTSALCAKAPYVPGPPQSVVQTRSTATKQIKLTWATPADTGGVPLMRYWVTRTTTSNGAPEPGFPKDIGVSLLLTDDVGKDCVTRFYKVRAENVAGNGSYAPEVQAKTPCVPSAPRSFVAASGAVPSTVDLSWLAPLDDGGLDVTGYILSRTTVANGPLFEWDSLNGDQRTDSDILRIPGVRYYYRAYAVNAVGNGANSTWATARASVTAPAVDSDGDAIPDQVESRVCNTAAIASLLRQVGLLGECVSSDWVAQSTLDGDEDWIPEILEPTLCGLQDNTDPTDGICVSRGGTDLDDYGWPPSL
jgi:Kelch motif protein